jgi:hypothetical protein
MGPEVIEQAAGEGQIVFGLADDPDEVPRR